MRTHTGPPKPRPKPMPRTKERKSVSKRSIPYKGFTIELYPDENLGVKAAVVQYKGCATAALHTTAFRNEFPMGRGKPSGHRTSIESAQVALKNCKAWIDKRVDVEGAIKDVEVEKS